MFIRRNRLSAPLSASLSVTIGTIKLPAYVDLPVFRQALNSRPTKGESILFSVNSRTYTTPSYQTCSVSSLHPYFLTGFVDAEGCYMLIIRKNQKCLTGYSVELVFQIQLHKKDRRARARDELIQST
jgi:hypothetical protein